MIRYIQRFFQLESASGLILIKATLIAILLVNLGGNEFYNRLVHSPIGITFGNFNFQKNLNLFVNDALMAVFFLFVALEIKRELIVGSLNSIKKVSLPLFAAIGGVAFPAIIYLLFNYNNPDYLIGWAIPSATDIAFAVAVIVMLGKRIPQELKYVLLAIAIIDDLFAIVIIALFYSSALQLEYLFYSLIIIMVLIFLNYKQVSLIRVYMLIGLFLWYAIFKSGIHATIAGVILAFTIPVKAKDKKIINKIIHNIEGTVAFVIMPIFAFMNSGVLLSEYNFESIFHPISLGIIIGLFVGKQLGIFTFTYIAIKLKFSELPKFVNLKMYYGMSIICGIGFTMSLFIGNLSFPDQPELQNYVKGSVILGSFISAIVGYLVLKNNNPLQKINQK